MRAASRIVLTTIAAVAIWLAVRPTAGEDVRYTAVFTDGNRITGRISPIGETRTISRG